MGDDMVYVTVYLPAGLHDRWKATGVVAGDGRPVPLRRLAELGLGAFAAGQRGSDPVEAVAARAVRAALAGAGLLAAREGAGVQATVYMPAEVRRRWKSTGLSLSALIERGVAAFWAESGLVPPPDAVDVVIARKVREGLAEAGLLASP